MSNFGNFGNLWKFCAFSGPLGTGNLGDLMIVLMVGDPEQT